MNIAHILSANTQLPLTLHNGRYELALTLAKAQAAEGHTVTVYCAPSSGAGLPELHWKSAPHLPETKANLALMKAALANPEHDIYHSHLDLTHYLAGDSTSKPIVFTQHWFPSKKVSEAAALNTRKNVWAVPPTKYIGRTDTQLGIQVAEVIPHGIDLERFVFTPDTPRSRFVFVGRIAPGKGVRQAVAYAKAAGVPLDIIGKITEDNQAYWESILPDIDGTQIRYLGPKDHTEIPAFFGAAKGFLFPTQEAEAFGLVTIEAQACGAPVIIGDKGASSELIQEGKTGFIARTDADFIHALQNTASLDPAACRSFAEQFDEKAMFRAYERLYRRLLA